MSDSVCEERIDYMNKNNICVTNDNSVNGKRQLHVYHLEISIKYACVNAAAAWGHLAALPSAFNTLYLLMLYSVCEYVCVSHLFASSTATHSQRAIFHWRHIHGIIRNLYDSWCVCVCRFHGGTSTIQSTVLNVMVSKGMRSKSEGAKKSDDVDDRTWNIVLALLSLCFGLARSVSDRDSVRMQAQ